MNYWLHPEAAAEHIEHVTYYEATQAGLGQRYHLAFEVTVARICEAPLRYSVALAPAVRKARLPGFPFDVLYREQKGTVHILAVAHHRRRPAYWAGRT